jgi:hypothetical protein
MKAHSTWKSRSTRQIVTLEAYDSRTVVYRQKEGNALTDLIIVSIGEFLTNFMEVES